MKVLVACEFSGIVRDAFAALGHEAWSCDLLPTERPGPHIVGDVRMHLLGWDLVIAHPPCTHLAVSGARWWRGREAEQAAALDFVSELLDAPAPMIALENPIGCLWLKGLSALVPTEIVGGRHGRVHREPPGPDRWKNRSRTYPGIARAMADQWGGRP